MKAVYIFCIRRSFKLKHLVILFLTLIIIFTCYFFYRLSPTGDTQQSLRNNGENNQQASGLSPTRASNSVRNQRTNISNVNPDFDSMISDVSWSERQYIFTIAIEKESVSLEHMWSAFADYNSKSSDVIGPAQVVGVLFRGFAERDPQFGIQCLETLNSGYVRKTALMNLSSSLAVEYVTTLHDSLIKTGYQEDIEIFLQGLRSSSSAYTTDDINQVLAMDFLDERTITHFKNLLIRREIDQLPRDKTRRKPYADETSLNNKRFIDLFQESKFDGAQALQSGRFPETVIDSNLVRDVARALAADDPPKAASWANKWRDPDRRAVAIAASISTWAQLDPMSCSKYINDHDDQTFIDISSGALAEYLASMKDMTSSELWLNRIKNKELVSKVRSKIAEDQ